ncbi:MAG: hypothetical protein AAGA48_39200 [Myxococcota bacterium]
MFVWTSSLVLGLLGCAEEEGPPPVFRNPTATFGDSGMEPLPPLRETRLRVNAVFRVDEDTGLPGPWLNESSGDSTSAIQFIVGDDEYDGLNGNSCEVLVPIRGIGAQRLPYLDEDEFWGASLLVDLDQVITNCENPEYSRIWEFYSGSLVEFLTTNRDGSEVDWAILVERPSANAVGWATSSSIEEERIIGGEVRLSDRWTFSRVEAIATIAFEAEPDGTLVVDAGGDNIPILLADVPQADGVKNGVYRFIGYQYQVVSSGP